MQMHTGEVDRERLAAFVKDNGNVAAYEVAEFLNLNGSDIKLGDHSFADSVEDNGLAVQSKNLDYLLTMENQLSNQSQVNCMFPWSSKSRGLRRLVIRQNLLARHLLLTVFTGWHNELANGRFKTFLIAPKRL